MPFYIYIQQGQRLTTSQYNPKGCKGVIKSNICFVSPLQVAIDEHFCEASHFIMKTHMIVVFRGGMPQRHYPHFVVICTRCI